MYIYIYRIGFVSIYVSIYIYIYICVYIYIYIYICIDVYIFYMCTSEATCHGRFPSTAGWELKSLSSGFGGCRLLSVYS